MDINKFLQNTIWLNMKRMKSGLFWRLLLLIINGMLFAAGFFPFSKQVVQYVFLLVIFSNILFVNVLVSTQRSAFVLLRSLGASKLFILIDNLVEVIIEIFIPGIVFLAMMIFIKPYYNPAVLIGLDILITSVIIPIFTYLAIAKLEKQKKDL